MRAVRTTSFVFIFFLLAKLSFAQQKWPSSFLWRITGHGLTKPSYLYGTIHLQDKRLFQFSDSLYHSLENVDGFALEIDFSEFMDSVFARTLNEAEKEYLDDHEKVKVDKKKIDKSVDSILKSLKLDPDRLTKKDLKRIRDYRMNKLVQQGEMKTIVDGYLYGLAIRLGKWTGGIEDVVDQLDLMDEMGANLTTEEVFQPEANLRMGLQEMIKIYVNRDLQSLANYIDGSYTQNYRDELLIHRNVKMARRMDSLSSLRTMFFAVGAAHLPGDSGVISLLRSRGFTVEPIFSPQSITPEIYSARLNTIPWKKVESDELYSINMPGNPSDFNLFGQAVKMKIFFDLPTMTFYMSGRTIATSNSTGNIDDAIKNMAERFGSNPKKVKTKDVSSGDLVGKEGRFDIEGYTYVVRFLQKKSTLYILMIGSAGKSKLDNADMDKFFSSFSTNDISPTDKKWTEFTIPGKGFTIKMPGTPRPNTSIDKKAEGSNWRFLTYDLPDHEKGLFYLLQLREVQSGFFLEGDTSYFQLYKQSMADVFEKVLSEEKFSYLGWPAFKIDFAFNKDGIYRIYSVSRGNRIYMLAAGGDKKADLSEVDRAFHSLTFEDLPTANWKKYNSEGFSSTAPDLFVKRKKDSTDTDQEHFVSYDPHELISYEVFRRPFSPYYWIKDDTSYFKAKVGEYKNYYDSVLKQDYVYNGKLKAVDFVIQKPSNNTLRRIRMFVSGDSLYTLMAMVPAQYSNNENLNRFFSDFRLTKEMEPTIYSSKAKQLLEALKTKDSVEFAKVSDVFGSVTFEKGDLPLLHQALLENYLAEYSYRTLNAHIVDVLEKLADKSTIEFIQKNYKTLNGDKEALKYNLLEVLADMKTTESYSTLKKLALESPPATGEEYRLSFSLLDSLLLTKTLYPEILKLSSDSIFSQVLVKVTNEMLDSSMISVNDVLPFKQNFIRQANNYLQLLKTDEDKWWAYSDWIRLIGKFNDKESNQILAEYLTLKKVDVSYYAIIELARNGQPINSAELERVAADKDYRANLYDELKKIGKVKVFPAKYSSQKKLAESEIYKMAVSDDDDVAPESVTFLEERTTEFMGKPQKFYLFKIYYKGEDYSSNYLGITGPYSPASKELIAFNTATAILWDEEFDKKKIDEQFKTLVAEQEKYLKESEETEKNKK